MKCCRNLTHQIIALGANTSLWRFCWFCDVLCWLTLTHVHSLYLSSMLTVCKYPFPVSPPLTIGNPQSWGGSMCRQWWHIWSPPSRSCTQEAWIQTHSRSCTARRTWRWNTWRSKHQAKIRTSTYYTVTCNNTQYSVHYVMRWRWNSYIQRRIVSNKDTF